MHFTYASELSFCTWQKHIFNNRIPIGFIKIVDYSRIVSGECSTDGIIVGVGDSTTRSMTQGYLKSEQNFLIGKYLRKKAPKFAIK